MTSKRTDKHFLDLIHRHQSILHKICFAYCRSRQDREDLRQEILLQLWKSYPSFHGKARFSTWMYRVALNTAINRTSKPGFLGDAYSATDPSYDPVAEYELSEEIGILHRAIARLKKVEKAIILMWLDEHSYREIADTIGITEKNVSVKLVRLKNRLAEIIKTLQ